jgi:hypothetical protein
MLAAGASLVVRFRRSHPHTVERQQLKWFTYAGTLLVLWMLLALGVDILLAGGFNRVIFALFVSLVPIAAGVAILRYRLYDVDRLINRTLVYGLLTAVLGGVYAGLVLVLGQLFGGIGAEPPSWGGGWRHAGCGRHVPTSPPPHPSRCRPAFQQAPPRRAVRRAAGGGRPDCAADPVVAVASPIGPRIAAHRYLTRSVL